MERRSIIRTLALGVLSASALQAAVRGDEVLYVGGTFTEIPDRTEGRLDLSSAQEATFHSKKGGFQLAYAKITSLEYGQKAGRRLGVALVVNPLFLFSKKRKHFLTVGFTDSGGQAQGVVLEVGKKHIREVIAALETRSGKKVEYESQEARAHVGN